MLLSRKQFLGFAHSPAWKEGSWASFPSNQHGSRDVFSSFPSGEVRAVEGLLCAELQVFGKELLSNHHQASHDHLSYHRVTKPLLWGAGLQWSGRKQGDQTQDTPNTQWGEKATELFITRGTAGSNPVTHGQMAYIKRTTPHSPKPLNFGRDLLSG